MKTDNLETITFWAIKRPYNLTPEGRRKLADLAIARNKTVRQREGVARKQRRCPNFRKTKKIPTMTC